MERTRVNRREMNGDVRSVPRDETHEGEEARLGRRQLEPSRLNPRCKNSWPGSGTGCQEPCGRRLCRSSGAGGSSGAWAAGVASVRPSSWTSPPGHSRQLPLHVAGADKRHKVQTAPVSGTAAMSEERRRSLTVGKVPVVQSACHTVFYEVPSAAAGRTEPPPVSVPPADAAVDLWDERHVRLPCSPNSLYPVRQPDGQMKLVQRWSMVQEALLGEIKTSADLESAIKSYNSRYKDKWDFSALRHFIDEVLGDEERDHLFTVTLPRLTRLALRLPSLLGRPIPLLRRHATRSLSFSQLQVAALLANAFFCTFPRRNAAAKRADRLAEYSSFPDINFVRLYAASGRGRGGVSQRRVEKLKCLLHYFHRVLERPPAGAVTFTRRHLAADELPAWAGAATALRQLTCHSDGLIEDQEDMLQVDFANKFVGGGVLGDGCVQEEIRFLINPELIVSRLFTEVLDRTECMVVTGCQRFSKFEGYADSFRWKAKAHDPSPMDEYGRRSTQVVALDAFHFMQAGRQYEESFLLRELNKAYVGFYFDGVSELPPVATGNWGCGAFKGDPRLKALLQLMAAALTRRDVTYLTFGDERLRDDLRRVHTFLRERQVTVGQLYKALLAYGRLYSGQKSRPDVFSFTCEHFDEDYGSDTDMEREDWSQEMEPPASMDSAALSPTADSESPPLSQAADSGSAPPSQTADSESAPLSQTADSESAPLSQTADSESSPVSPSADSETTSLGREVSSECASGGDAALERTDGTDSAGPSHSVVEPQRQQQLLLEAAAGDPADPDDSADGDLAVRLAAVGPSARAAAGAKRVRRADSDGAESAERAFARFEVVSETSRSRGLRQANITSYLSNK